MKTQVNLKIDTDIKKRAQKTAKALGLSLSSVVNASLIQFAKTGELNLSTTPKITPHLENIVRQAREEYAKSEAEGPFSNAKDFMRSLKS